jgi:hypothetical protein
MPRVSAGLMMCTTHPWAPGYDCIGQKGHSERHCPGASLHTSAFGAVSTKGATEADRGMRHPAIAPCKVTIHPGEVHENTTSRFADGFSEAAFIFILLRVNREVEDFDRLPYPVMAMSRSSLTSGTPKDLAAALCSFFSSVHSCMKIKNFPTSSVLPASRSGAH